MASSFDFLPRPVGHAPSQFGFGFGLGPSAGPTPWLSNPTPTFYQPSNTFSQSPGKLKRKLDDDDIPPSDYTMDRSPTPERPKRAAPKRARVAPEPGSKDDRDGKENKAPSPAEETEVDVGVLLASLPPQSLLPLLTSLLSTQPSLKKVVLSLIPRPTLDSALQALTISARKLRDAYPYTNVTPNIGFGAARPTFGFPRPSTQPPAMRDSYVSSRLEPHIDEFVSASLSYLPYFSYLPSSNEPVAKGAIHPSEVYSFLSALMQHALALPPLAQSQLASKLITRLNDEWKAWVNKVDVTLNQEGGMFTADSLRTWERGLDQFASSQGEFGDMMRPLRDLWIAKPHMSDERQCRICLAGPEEEAELGRMIKPCLCTGSIKFVHVKCLQRWRNSSSSPANSARFFSCPQCGYKYRFTRTKVLGLATNPVIVGTLSAFLFTVLVILSSFITTFFMSWFEEPSYSSYYYRSGPGGFFSGFFYVSPLEIVQDLIRAAVRIIQDEDIAGTSHHHTSTAEPTEEPERGIIQSLIRRFFLGLPIIGASRQDSPSLIHLTLTFRIQCGPNAAFIALDHSRAWLGKMALKQSTPRSRGRKVQSFNRFYLYCLNKPVRALIKVYSFTESVTKRVLLRAEDAILEV
ncbi:hypothetical protein MIND_00478000 [Mycena indigotica]|uniref:Tethering factor for nuclear proteasome STS1 n=1 Tax=Mycena indigotica TaxID=2126181 RepID=A0A8H6W9Q6_9AGAR|nr:uncharacterized protein MIND_00478000 [Mycena indigotica]KAF7306858.1 hypothetical protein MIND_00478000 [Mycena indigotica]